MKVIVVGAAGPTRELLPRLSEMWEASVVDVSAKRLEALAEVARFRAVCGDGSSRVVLERAGLAETDALIAATGDDRINMEACRLAAEAGIRRLSALITDLSRQDDYRALGVPTISVAQLTARRIESHLERRRISSTSFADGRAEAIEFRVAPDSPVCGRALNELGAQSWVVGVILRKGNLIIPHGNTVIEADDMVTVIGAGVEFAEMVHAFSAGEQRFPLDFGKNVAVALEGVASLAGPVGEAVQLVRNSRAASLLQVHADPEAIADSRAAAEISELIGRAAELCDGVAFEPRPVRGKPARLLERLPVDESVGVIVVPAPDSHGLAGLRRTGRAAALARRTGKPVLISRASQPYRRILVPAQDSPASRAAVRAAIDLARFQSGMLLGVAVLDPVFFTGPAARNGDRDVLAEIEEHAGVHGVPVDAVIRRGNPVRLLAECGEDSDLLVLGLSERRRRWTMRAGIAELVALRSSKSVLLVPVRD